jgi:microcompartment protein CcmK/EutM
MLLARVTGNIVATQKEQNLLGGRILLVQPVAVDGHTPQGSALIALDSVDAGSGDLVIIVQEGWSASTATTGKEGFAIDAAIIGVVDTLDLV